VIAFYGDHLPGLPDSFFEDIHGGPFEDLTQNQQRYTVPFFVWANYDIPEQEIPFTSINYLPNFIYQAAGMEMPQYNQLLASYQTMIPAMNSQGFYSAAAGGFLTFEEASDEEKAVLDQYWQLQYNNMFDDENHISIFRVPEYLLPEQQRTDVPPGDASPSPSPATEAQ
jgi:hypothetical protein